MSIADDIQKARDAGHSDDQILSAISQFDPKQGADIRTALEAKHAPSDILNSITKFDSQYGPEAQRGIVDKVTAPFRHGLSEAAAGYKATAHETGNDGTVSDTMGSVSKAVAPDNYTPSDVAGKLRGGRIGAALADIPKAVAEAAPGMAPDIAAGAAGAAIGGAVGGPFAPITAPIGGAIGATGSYLLRNYGNDARSAAAARGASSDSELTNGDKARALLMGGVGGIASRVGLGALGSPVKAEAGSVASQLIPQFAKGAAIDAGTGVAQEGAHQALIDQQFDPAKLAGAAATGAGTGVALRGVASVKDGVAASKYSKMDNELANPVANDLVAVESPHTPGSGEDSFHRMQKVSDDYGSLVKDTLSSKPVQERLAALEEHDPLDPTARTLDIVQKDIKAGRKPSQDDLDLIHNRLGDVDTGGPGITDLFKRQDTLNQLKSVGNWDEGKQTFTGGATSTKFVQNVLNPLSKFGGAADAGALVYAATGHTLPGLSVFHAMADPVSAVSIPIAQASIYGGLHAMDRITGNRNPLKQFTDRFSGGEGGGPTDASGTPSGRGPGPETGAEIAARVAAVRALEQANRITPEERILARHERSDADYINSQKNREATKAASTQRQSERVVANHERSDAETINRQKTAAVVKAASEAARAERIVANHERGDAETINRERNSEAKVVANHERGDAETINRQKTSAAVKSASEAARAARIVANHERGDAETINRSRDQESRVVANHERGDAETVNRQRDREAKTVANHERGDAETINQKRDSTIRRNESAVQSLDRQRSGAFVKEQVRLEAAKAQLDKQRSAAHGKMAEEEFNGPKEDASLRIRVAKYKQDLEARREATALQAQKAQAKELAAQAKLDAKRKPAAEGKASASPAEVSLAQNELQSAIKEARVATKAAGKAKADHQKAKSDAPETTPIVTDHGTRMQPIEDIRVSKRAIANGIMKRAGTRKDAADNLTALTLTPTGHHYLIDHIDGILKHSFDNSDSHTARDHIEDVLHGMPRDDAKIVRDHLKKHGYYKTWKG